MAELLARFSGSDSALLERVLSAARHGDGAAPDRVVVDAHVVDREPRFATLSRAAGIPLVVDPQTHYLQDEQHPGDPWAQLSYADPSAWTPRDLSSPGRQDALVAGAIEYQLSQNATAVLAPYVHIERDVDCWLDVQLALWRRTRRYLDRQNLAPPVVAVAAIGWRLLDRARWVTGVGLMTPVLRDMGADEIALAASKVDQGARPDERLAGLVAAIQELRRYAPVLAWNQGIFGEAAVAAGATGYETGIGWRERCDLRSAAASHRRPPQTANFGARPVYVPALRRSLPKRTLRALLESRVGPQLLCMDYRCCPDGAASLLGDARAHALRQRAHDLHLLDRIDRPDWLWQRLADNSDAALQLAERVNKLADRRDDLTRIDTSALRATQAIANNRRQTLGRRRAA